MTAGKISEANKQCLRGSRALPIIIPAKAAQIMVPRKLKMRVRRTTKNITMHQPAK
jgi:hypothetical protein